MSFICEVKSHRIADNLVGSIVLVLASAYILKLQLELALCTVWDGVAVIPDALVVQVIQPIRPGSTVCNE